MAWEPLKNDEVEVSNYPGQTAKYQKYAMEKAAEIKSFLESQ